MGQVNEGKPSIRLPNIFRESISKIYFQGRVRKECHHNGVKREYDVFPDEGHSVGISA